MDEGELEEDAEGIKCSSCHKSEAGFRLQPDLDPTKRTLQQAYQRLTLYIENSPLFQIDPEPFTQEVDRLAAALVETENRVAGSIQ